MEYLVWLGVIVIAVFTFMGLKVGLVRRVVELGGLVVAFLVATNLAPRFHEELADAVGLPEKAGLYTTWVLLFLVGLALTRVAAWIVSKTVRISVVGWLDRLGGAVLGLLIGSVMVSVIAIGGSQVPGGQSVQDAFMEYRWSRTVYEAAPWLLTNFRKLGGDEQKVWDRFLEEIKRPTEMSRVSLSASGGGPAHRG